MNHVEVEIAICTWNRADLLRQTLDSIERLVVPELLVPTKCSVKVIVINNGSTDQTAAVLENFQRFPLTVVDEPRQGHAICRNRAVEAARGDLLVWTDDDVIVSPTWLVNYVAAFRRDPKHAFWGGPIIAKLPTDAPAWVSENFETLTGCFAQRDLGPKPLALTAATLPYGANFAVRTEIQKQFLFDETLGRVGTGLDGGEETEMLFRLIQAGHKGSWVPEASLDHLVASARLTDQWIGAYYAGQGRAMVRASRAWSTNAWWLAIQQKYHAYRYRSLRKSAPSPAWLGHLIRSNLAQGQVEALRAK